MPGQPVTPSSALVPPDAEAVRVGVSSSPGGTVRLPGSKSITNRALLMSALARGASLLKNPLDCDDSRHLSKALGQLGVPVRWEPDGSLHVTGAGGPFPIRDAEVFCGNAGTALRFLTGALAACGGRYVVDGDDRMRERPIGDLVRALSALGADISASTGCPPVHIGPRPFVGGRVDIPGSVSSQFVSAILMAAPLASRRVEVRVTGELVSRPYIDLTIQGMREYGARVYANDRRDDGQPLFEVVPGHLYRGDEHTIEGDASAASYFYAAAAVTGSTVRVEGVGKETHQGDARVADALAEMGCRVKKDADSITVTGPRDILDRLDLDCGDMPDVVPTLAVVALFARGKTRLRGVAHLRHKESDRIASMATELRKLGVEVRELSDGLEIEGTLGPGPSALRRAAIESWGDHRVAMAFSVAALAIPGIVIARPQVVSKSFPGFFGALRSIGASVEFLGPGGVPLSGDERALETRA